MFKGRSIIKIDGKSFGDLSIDEVAAMIDADSSLSPDGNEYFDSCALDEFLHCADLDGRPDLEKIRVEILENIYLDFEGSRAREINTDFLTSFSERLRSAKAG